MSDPHLGGRPPPRALYSEIGRLKKSERLKRNVLEITVERDERAGDVTDAMISNLFNRLRIKMSDVEAIQLVPEKQPKRVFA